MERPGERRQDEPAGQESEGDAAGRRILPPLRVPQGGTEEKAPPREAPPTPADLPPLTPPTQKEPVPAQPLSVPPAKAEPTPVATKSASGLRVALWIFVPLVILAAIVAAVLSGSSKPTTQGTSLSLGFGTPKSTSLYRSQRIMEGYVQGSDGKQVPFQLAMTEYQSNKVDSLTGSGTKLDVSTSAWGTYNGQNLPQLFVDTPVTVRSDGKVTSGGKIPLVSLQSHIGAAPGTDLFLPTLPARPVSPGDTWLVDYRRPFALPDGGSMEYETQSRLVRFRTVSGVRAAVVATTAQIPVDVTVDLPTLRPLAPGALNRLLAPLGPGADPRLVYHGTVTYQLTSTLDPAAHQLLRSDVTGRVKLRVTVKGAGSPNSFRIESGLRQVTRKVS